jgi:dihydrolipoamide dehydrogenase
MVYDLGIIGAGPAGYIAAERAGQKGLKVVLFEKDNLGGVCLNEGCIPTKTLLYVAKLYENGKNSELYGLKCSDVTFDFHQIMKRKDRVVKKLVGGVDVKMKKYKVDVIKEHVAIERKENELTKLNTGNNIWSCKNILISTGSLPIIPPIKGLKREEIYTNKEILEIEELPESLIIIGGGAIGMEFAGFFSSMGSKVSIFEIMPEILPGTDREIAKMLRNELEKKGVDFYFNARVKEIKPGKNTMTALAESDGKQIEVSAEKLLVSVGREPVIKGFGLENIGVLTEKGRILVDNKCLTNIPNVYAAGDVTGKSFLAHSASRQGEVVVNNISGVRDLMRYNAIPSVIYTNPEIACVGITEEEAQKRNIRYKISSLPMAYSGRFVAENEGKNGLIKIITGEKYGEILGVHMIGNPSSEIIYGAAEMIETELRIKDIREIIFPHPTVSEIIKEAVFSF